MGFRRTSRKSKDALTAVGLAVRSQGYRWSALYTSWRFLHFARRFGYEPVEAFRLGMFDPLFDTAGLRAFVSRKQTTRMQEALNPPILAGLFKNKVLFHRTCRSHELPVPKLYGVFSAAAKTTHTCRNEALVPANDVSTIPDALPQRFALKPAEGSLGAGFKIMTRLNGGFQDHDGVFYTTDAFLRLLVQSSPVGSLMQEIVENHPLITSFTGVAALQTVRVITLVGASDRVEILSAFLKTIIDTRIVIDTHLENLKGNLEVLIEPADGSLGEASYLDGDGKGIVIMDNHPVSGNPFKGFIIPCWPQVRDLAARAAAMALPVRTIGWDIAITPDGPCLIEGNIWWNPPNQHRAMPRIARRMKSAITELSDANQTPRQD